jgi:hypothetical protein
VKKPNVTHKKTEKMGARGSSLVGKATVHEKLMPYTSFGKKDILEMRLRHLHDLGGR